MALMKEKTDSVTALQLQNFYDAMDTGRSHVMMKRGDIREYRYRSARSSDITKSYPLTSHIVRQIYERYMKNPNAIKTLMGKRSRSTDATDKMNSKMGELDNFKFINKNKYWFKLMHLLKLKESILDQKVKMEGKKLYA